MLLFVCVELLPGLKFKHKIVLFFKMGLKMRLKLCKPVKPSRHNDKILFYFILFLTNFLKNGFGIFKFLL